MSSFDYCPKRNPIPNRIAILSGDLAKLEATMVTIRLGFENFLCFQFSTDWGGIFFIAAIHKKQIDTLNIVPMTTEVKILQYNRLDENRFFQKNFESKLKIAPVF